MNFQYEQALTLLDSLADGLLVQAVPGGGVVHVNSGFLNLLVCDRSSLDQRPDGWIEQIYREDQTLMRQWWGQLLHRPSSAEQTYRILQPDGQLRWIQCRSLQVDAIAGASPWLATLHVDVTGQRQSASCFPSPCDYLQTILGPLLIGIGYCDATGRILWTNDAFHRLLAYPCGTLIHRSLQSLVAPSSQSGLMSEGSIFEHSWSRELELLNGHQQSCWMLTTIAPLPPQPQSPATCLCMVQDITRYKRAEDELRASLQDTEVLIAEIHHRVKNNLQIISSLLELQATRTQDLTAQRILLSSQDRVLAMSLIHETLYQSDNMAQINFEAYVQQLVSGLSRAYGADRQVRFNLAIDDTTTISTNLAVPLGLILNELVTNALKHSLTASRQGILMITLHPLPTRQFKLCVKQTKGRLPPDFSLDQSASMGLQIVKLLTQKIGATLTIQHNPTVFNIVFSKEQ